MSEFGDLIPEFVEESLEHLKNIEEDIIIIEQGSADKELINRVFRAVHSIKGGSSFLGLRNIELLSHKMEDIFNLVRNDELNFTSGISTAVLRSIDTLKEMLEESDESDNINIEANIRELKDCLSAKPVDQVAEKIKEDIEEASIQLDKKSFDELRKQGKKVYLIQFELKEEAQGGRNPLDFFNEIEKTGEILARNVDMELVLKDDNFTGEGIPLSILYATVLERDLVAHIFGIAEECAKEIVPDSLIEEEVIRDVKDMGDFQEETMTTGDSYSSNHATTAAAPMSYPNNDNELSRGRFNDELYYEDSDIAVREDMSAGSDTAAEHVERIDLPVEENLDQIDSEEYLVEDELDIDDVKENNEYLTFWVDKEEYGINITQVHEIVTLHEITPVPGGEPYTRGVVNLRGDILPVFDFRLRLKFDEREYDHETVILIVMINDKKVGVVVDRVSEVIQLKRDQVTDAPQMQDIPPEYVIGIGQKDDKFIILLKLKEIFKSGNVK